ncbi:hypothetical protein [Gordonia sp. (in: high G+C Gram-positive bacteria)]|uniref:hypothetical protein n=1 Tax=Gordonia sp. (in: high G+C Gram-positive bacteria) TaxID=84139 RepID=UPI003C70E2CB
MTESDASVDDAATDIAAGGATDFADDTAAADSPKAAPKRGTARRTAKAAVKRKDRIERYEARLGDGSVVTVERNIDTGTTEIVED